MTSRPQDAQQIQKISAVSSTATASEDKCNHQRYHRSNHETSRSFLKRRVVNQRISDKSQSTLPNISHHSATRKNTTQECHTAGQERHHAGAPRRHSTSRTQEQLARHCKSPRQTQARHIVHRLSSRRISSSHLFDARRQSIASVQNSTYMPFLALSSLPTFLRWPPSSTRFPSWFTMEHICGLMPRPSSWIVQEGPLPTRTWVGGSRRTH